MQINHKPCSNAYFIGTHQDAAEGKVYDWPVGQRELCGSAWMHAAVRVAVWHRSTHPHSTGRAAAPSAVQHVAFATVQKVSVLCNIS